MAKFSVVSIHLALSSVRPLNDNMDNTRTWPAGESDGPKPFHSGSLDHIEFPLNNPEDSTTSSLHDPTVEPEEVDNNAPLPSPRSMICPPTTPTLNTLSSPASALQSNPILQAVFPKSSPFKRPSKLGDGTIPSLPDMPSTAPPSDPASRTRPTSSQTLDSEDEFGLGTNENALSQLRNIQLLDLNQITKDLNAVEEEIRNFERKIETGNLASSYYRKKSKFWGWGTIIGMTSLAAVVVTRVNKHLSLSTCTTLLAGALVMTGVCGSYSVAAEQNRLHADMDSSLFEQFLPTLQHRRAERKNARAVKMFYNHLTSTDDFVFGRYFSTKSRLFQTKFRLTEEQERSLASIHTKFQELRPLPMDIANALTVEVAALTIYHSNRIENAGLALSETEIIIKGLFCPGGMQPMSRFLETWTHAKALAIVIEYLRTGLTRYNFRPSHMREIHKCLIAEDPSACPGNYRSNMAFIGTNPDQVLASPPEIDDLVQKVFQYVNETEDHEVEILTNVHAWLIRIHPFADGNGRVIRLIMAFLALAAGYTGIALTGGVDEYFKGIRCWDDTPEEFGGIIVREMMKMFVVYEKAQERAEEFAKNRNRKEFMIVK